MGASPFFQEIWVGTTDTGYGGASHDNRVNVLDYTVSLSRYGFIASQESSIVFGIQSCKDAFVYLSSSSVMDSQKAFYEIVFGGGNGKYLIFRRNNIVWQELAYLPAAINCLSFSFFWISWKNGNIKIGRGPEVNIDIIYDFMDPESWPINGVGVRTYYSIGQWIIYQRPTGYMCNAVWSRSNMAVLKTVEAGRYSCALECNRELKCLGFNHNEQTMSCQLISTGQTESFSSEQYWEYVVKCFESKCLGCLK